MCSLRIVLSRHRWQRCCVWLLVALTSAHGASAAVIDERINQAGIAGTLVICGGIDIPTPAKQAFVNAIIPGKPVVILVTPADSGDTESDTAADVDQTLQWMAQLGVDATVESVFLSPDLKTLPDDLKTLPDDPVRTSEQAKVAARLRGAGGVWFCGGEPARLAKIFVTAEVQAALVDLLDRGGVIAGASAGAAIMTNIMMESGLKEPQLTTGLDLLADAIIDYQFTQLERTERLRAAISRHPQRFGLGIDEATAVVVHGRDVNVVGQGNVTIVLAKVSGRDSDANQSGHREEVVQPMPAGSTADLTQLRRAARWRGAGRNPGEPNGSDRIVPSGSLVIVGGGGMPQAIVDRFIELAGGKDAKIVVLPTAIPRAQALLERPPGFISGAGVASVTMLPQSRTDEVASEAFRMALNEATGVWFDGGRQWNFVDAYENTPAVELFHAVLRRGGVIGGSSAGATIQGEYLVRGHPLGNFVMMAEGYERGFAFLPGVAIDQHFAQRNRFDDLVTVVKRHPKLLGIGIDESTAIVVTGNRAEVIGRHAAHFVAGRAIAPSPIEEPGKHNQAQPVAANAEPAEPLVPVDRYQTVAAGETFDLQLLQLVERR